MAAGGLVSCLASTPDVFSRAISQPDYRSSKSSKVGQIINLNPVTALGLTVPPTPLARSDEVID